MCLLQHFNHAACEHKRAIKGVVRVTPPHKDPPRGEPRERNTSASQDPRATKKKKNCPKVTAFAHTCKKILKSVALLLLILYMNSTSQSYRTKTSKLKNQLKNQLNQLKHHKSKQQAFQLCTTTLSENSKGRWRAKEASRHDGKVKPLKLATSWNVGRVRQAGKAAILNTPK